MITEGNFRSTAYQDRVLADTQKFVQRTVRREHRIVAIASRDYEIALRFHSAITDCRGDRSIRLEKLGINSVLAKMSIGDGNGFMHGLLIALLGREDHQ